FEDVLFFKKRKKVIQKWLKERKYVAQNELFLTVLEISLNVSEVVTQPA
ncbi:18769_t:CDS:1, partial [Gigaspora rosea]